MPIIEVLLQVDFAVTVSVNGLEGLIDDNLFDIFIFQGVFEEDKLALSKFFVFIDIGGIESSPITIVHFVVFLGIKV